MVARHEPGPRVAPRAQAFAIGVSYPRPALVAACAAAVARRWPPCRRRRPPTTASPAWLSDIRVVEVSHAAGDVHGLVGLAFLGEGPGALYLAADVAIAGTEAPHAILGLPLLGPAHPPGSSPQPARTAAQPAAGRHQPGRACADHPDRLSQCLDRHRAEGSAERRISRAGRPVSCDRLSRNGSAWGGKSGAVAASDTASSGFRARHPHLDPRPPPKFEDHAALLPSTNPR